jgi:membrane-associated protein
MGIDSSWFDLSHLRVDSFPSYVIALGAPALDAVIPLIPSESAIIALGVATSGTTDPRLFVLVGLAAVGAFLGDNLCYLIGHRYSPWIDRKVFSSVKGRARRTWAEEKLGRYGFGIILVCRFIPGGRTAVTLTCGATQFNRRQFVVATATSAVIWASYAFFLGRLGGKAFEGRSWLGLVVALGVALVVSGLIEVIRRLRSLRRGPADPKGS